jgi:hypothetical protein
MSDPDFSSRRSGDGSLEPHTPKPRKARSLGRTSGKKALALAAVHACSAHSDSENSSETHRSRRRPPSSAPLGGALVSASLSELIDLESGTPDPRARRSGTNSRKEKRPSVREPKRARPRVGLLIALAVCTILFGPIATLASYVRLSSVRRPAGPPSPAADAVTLRSHTLHLSLAGSDRKARMVLPRSADWAIFLAGCKERLQIAAVAQVTDESGDGIHSVRGGGAEGSRLALVLASHPGPDVGRRPDARGQPGRTRAAGRVGRSLRENERHRR